jgi:GTPase SAR1 family protein
MATKVSMVGKPEVGKTTIKKVIFEGEDPNELVIFPLEATIGIKYSVYNFLDLEISLLDTPGQSLPLLLEDEEKKLTIFGDTSAIIYIFDYPTWISNSQDVIDDIKKIYEIKKNQGNESRIILFLHKIDLLIKKKVGTILASIKEKLINQLNLSKELPIYFTSLHPNLIYTVYNALSEVLSNFSEEISNLKRIIEEILNGISKTICIVSNQKNNLIIQVSSNDFDANLLYYLYDFIYWSSESSEDMLSRGNWINAGSKLLYMLEEDIGKYHSNFKNLMIFSETLEESELNELIGNIKEQFAQYHK